MKNSLKNDVHDFWNKSSCGEIYGDVGSALNYYQSHAKKRYELEPYIQKFAEFSSGNDKAVLEIGVGMGADHIEWAKAKPKALFGIDLTERAIEHTRKRLAIYEMTSSLSTGDAEILAFKDATFDIVYSWGVLHHSPDTGKAISDVYRVLKPGGHTKIMIYYKYSLVGLMLWTRYAILKGKLLTPLREIYSKHLESPGTKAYSMKEAHKLFHEFSDIHMSVQLSFGDLLLGEVGQKHKGILLKIAKALYPRWLVRTLFFKFGLYLLIEARK